MGKGPGIGSARNGVPVVDITTPSQSGVSHNQYKDFNVSQQGLILNNNKVVGVSQLGGVIEGNANLKGGEARLILNEVTGSDRSRIQGYIEVFGKSADVILANPNGVTINGGGFINVPRATIATGRPDVDAAGNLRGIDVRGGDVRIEGAGINASNMDGFDIVTRAAMINAEIRANDLSITTGANRYDPATRTATAIKGDENPAPAVAIDSSALGGMYAGRITLKSTEKGVGVNLDGVVQSVNDMAITADGKLAVRAAKAGGDMQVASSGAVAVAEAAIADKNLAIAAKNVEVATGAALSAGSDITLEAQDKIIFAERSQVGAHRNTALSGKEALLARDVAVKAGDTLSINADEDIRLAEGARAVSGKKLQLSARSVRVGKDAAVASAGTVSVRAKDSIALDAKSRISSDAATTIATRTLDVGEGATMTAGSTLSVNASENVTIGGEANVIGRNSVTMEAENLQFDSNGVVASGKDVTLKAANDIRLAESSLVSAGETALVQANSVSLATDATLEGKAVAVTSSLFNADNAVIQAVADLLVKASSLFMHQTAATAGNTIAMEGNSIALAESSVVAENDLNITAGAFHMRGDAVEGLESVDLGLTNGVLFSGRNFSLAGSDIATFNGGFVGSDGNLSLTGGGLNAGQHAYLYSGQDMSFAFGGTLGLDTMKILSGGNLGFNVGSVRLASSSVSSQGNMSGYSGSIQVGNGSFLGSHSGLLLAANDITNEGLLFSGGDAALRVSGTVSNLNGADIFAQGNLQLTGVDENSRMSRLFNNGANIESLSNLLLRADNFDNVGGSAEVSRVKYDQSYLHIGMSDFLPGYNSDGSFNLVTQSNAGSYRTDKKAYDKVIAYTAQQQALYGIPAAARDHLQEWKTAYREEVVGGVKGATLMAGMDMFIDAGNVANNLSAISAGRNLSINADILTNIGVDLYSATEVFRHFFSMGKHNEWEGSHTQAWSSSSIYKSVPSLLTAGQLLHINVTEGYDNSGRENADYIGVYSGSPAYQGLDVIGIGLNNPLAAGSGLVDRQTSMNIGQTFGSFVPNVSLGGLFSLSSNLNHPYLIETNPALTSIGSFYGSDYFLSKIGYDLTTEQRRLFGDSFFETRLVREQLLAQTGQRYLFESVADDAATMRLLMDNALEAGKSLGLSVGVSLTPEQIGNLSKDIIWLEEIEYEGQTVLAPRLYLCEATRAELTVRGGSVTADTVVIEGNGIKNSGLIRGNQVQLTSLTDILNRAARSPARTPCS